MTSLLSNLVIRVNDAVYLKDPESSDLGKRIVTGGINLIDEVGIESFSFGKLARAIGSTEASVYRYFESKHKMLLYLVSWYWVWLEYKLVFELSNVQSPEERLRRAIHILTQRTLEDENVRHIDEVKLNRIVIAESSKAYQTKEVDEENKHGVYAGYKSLVGRVSDIITEINPNYTGPHMLVSTVVEGAHTQYFFAEHLPRLTDVDDEHCDELIPQFYTELVFKAIS